MVDTIITDKWKKKAGCSNAYAFTLISKGKILKVLSRSSKIVCDCQPVRVLCIITYKQIKSEMMCVKSLKLLTRQQ